ncbi:MAG: chemotaxis protein CheA [Spirochaetes bacterium]|nr:chemotaxis protein CheA [Spirochaetota bacterium]
MSIAINEIQEMFLEESREILQNLETDIIQLEGNFNKELFDNIFRYVHTLKGSSGIAGFNNLYEFSHQLENLMDLVRSEVVKVDEKIIDLLLECLDWFKSMIFGSDSDKKTAEGNKQNLLNVIFEIIQKSIVSDSGKKNLKSAPSAQSGSDRLKYYRIKTVFREDIYEFGIDPLSIIEDLSKNGRIVKRKVNKSKLPDFSKINPEKCYISWEMIFETELNYDRISEIFLFVNDDNSIEISDITEKYLGRDVSSERKIGEILVDKGIISEEEMENVVLEQQKLNSKIGDIILEKGLASKEDVNNALQEQTAVRSRIENSTVRVDTGKLDSLLNLLGEIVINQSSINRIAEELDDEVVFKLKNSLHGLDRTTREFQEQIMSIRMVQIGATFEQFRRFVRDSAKESGKEINFVIEGKETELDKTVIEKISDPLKHMIRNSIDHGIETAEDRIASGKSPTGNLTLRAYHQEGNVFIEVKDDGHGLNTVKIRKKAVSLGLISEDEEVSESRLLNFIFNPGFSTADQIGALSGRGVGMDVVRTNIEALRGSIEIFSKSGEGTTIRIKLPLTLAIIEGMLVKVGVSIYIIPLLSIIESIQPKEESVKTIEGKGEVVMVRGEYVPLVRVYDFFGINSKYQNPWEGLIVVVESGEERIGLLVDELLGQQQIVIKNLYHDIATSRAISGAAILGNGNVSLIIDIHGLTSEYRH